MAQRIGGIMSLKVNGRQYSAKGNFTYNLGREKREAVIGADGVHGYKATPQVAFVEGEITDSFEIDLSRLVDTDGATVTLDLANGKSIVLRNAWFAGEGTGNTEEGNIAVRFEAKKAEEI
jgi:hypothetical protein